LLHKKDKGTLWVIFKKGIAPDSVICIVEDDGIGRKQSMQINKSNPQKSPSYGNDMARDLVRIFNTYEKMHIAIQYTDAETPLTGTKVEIIINKK
jgi:hypothetical protein